VSAEPDGNRRSCNAAILVKEIRLGVVTGGELGELHGTLYPAHFWTKLAI
jgi:hypothetical protein